MECVKQELTCVICLDTLTDPHQYPCGHSYCLSCINDVRRREDYRCPECRTEFISSSNVIRNYRLSNIANTLRNQVVSVDASKSRKQDLTEFSDQKMQESKSKATLQTCQPKQRVPSFDHYQKWLLLIIPLITAIFLAIVWKTIDKREHLDSSNEAHQNLRIHPQQQVTPGADSSVFEGVWSLVFLPFWCVRMLVRGLWWLASNLLSFFLLCLWFITSFLKLLTPTLCQAPSLFLLCLGFITSCFQLLVTMICTVVRGIVDNCGYFYGSCIVCFVILAVIGAIQEQYKKFKNTRLNPFALFKN